MSAVVRAEPINGAEETFRALIDSARNDVSEARRSEAEQRFLALASSLLSSSLDSRTVFDRLASLVVPALGDWCLVHATDGTEIRLTASAHADPDRAELARLVAERHPPSFQKENEHPAARVFRGDGSVLIEEVSERALRTVADDDHFVELQRLGFRSAMVVPLNGRDRVVATLTFVLGHSGRHYGTNDLALAEELASRAAPAVENARLYEAEKRARLAAERAADRTGRLQRLTEALSHALTPEDTARIMASQGRAALEGSVGLVWFLSPDGQSLALAAHNGEISGGLETYRRLTLRANSPVRDAVRWGRPIFLESAAMRTSLYPNHDYGHCHEAWAAVPLRIGNRPLGVFLLLFGEQRTFTSDDRGFMLAMAGQCAQVVERTRLFQSEQIAREAAEANEWKYRFLTEIMPQMVWTATSDGLLDHCNQNWIEFTGFDPTEATGSRWSRAIHAEDRAAALEAWQSAVATGRPFESIFRLHRVSDGSYRWFICRAQPLRDSDGRITKWMGTCTDIDDQKLAEESVRCSEEQIKVALELAKTADRRKDEFLALLGHELRNPLAPMATAVQLMKLKGDGRTIKEREVIERQVQHLSRLVDDLLDISRITRGKIELKMERVEIAMVVAKAIEMASPLLEKRAHNLKIEVPRGGLAVEADQVRLSQVFQNLITNAAKYTEPGGHIAVQARRDGEEIVISVADNGIGIPQALLPSMFDMFVQGSRTLDRAEGGLGIGLTLVQRLVTLHRGSVSALSEGPGTGSEFVVRLPASPLAANDEPAPQSTLSTRLPAEEARRRVLVVDDNLDIAETLGEMLMAAGHEVAVAHDGPAALAILAQFRPEIGLLDIGLPVMDGYELARRLRQELAPGTCTFIAVTGYGQENDRARSREAGFAHHLVKPIDLDQIHTLIREAP